LQHGGNVLLAAGFLLGGAGLSSRAQKSEETSAARLMDHLMRNRVATLALIVHGGLGDHWILENNPLQSSGTYLILSDASVFPVA
jgi:hypothetical protein